MRRRLGAARVIHTGGGSNGGPAPLNPLVNTSSISYTTSTAQYSEITAPPALLTPTDVMTAACWVKAPSQTNGRAIFAHWEGGTSNGRRFILTTSGIDSLRVFVGSSTGGEAKDYVSFPIIFDNTWHHVGFTANASADTLKLYNDGVLESGPSIVNNTSYGGSFDSSTFELMVGARQQSGSPSNAVQSLIDLPILINKELSNAEMAELANPAVHPMDMSFSDDIVWGSGDQEPETTTSWVDFTGNGNDMPHVGVVIGDIVTDSPTPAP